ncbi:MAG: hypothetical protein IH625_01380 [Rhodobacteraceae bacterium]|nr:hypothetical protein [Paracoccaceae bacterium]
MKRFALILAGLLLTSCVPPPAGPQGKVLSAAERAECLMQGGTVGRGGLLPDELCFRPEPDGGKACTRKTDCSGMCLAESNTCSKVTPLFGCFEFLDETGAKAQICID